MRLRFYFLLVGILGSISAWCQPYIPMLGQTNTWHAVSCFGGCGIDTYGTAGDTIVDGYTYRVLDGYHYIQGNFLIREDVSERKVYMKILAGHVLLDEFPIYDFSLQDGDTTHVYNPISPLPDDGGLFILDSIVSHPLETGVHRFFYLHAVDPVASVSDATVWVEGIGALSLINSPGGLPTEENHLGCAFKDGILQYADTDSIGSCSQLSSVPQSDESEIAIYPSAFQDEFYVEIDKPEVASVSIYTLEGVLVYSDKGNSGNRIQISGGELPFGMLLVQIEVDQKSHVSKVVHLR